MTTQAKKGLTPGDHVRTPYGIAWVNFHPRGEVRDGQVFVRLGDNSTRWIAASFATPVDF